MKLRGKYLATWMACVFLSACGGMDTASQPVSVQPGTTLPDPANNNSASDHPTETKSGGDSKPEKMGLETAEQAIERAKFVLGANKAARYEATHLDGWMPTVPTEKDKPRRAWNVRLYDASGRFMAWVVLDENTGEPLQMGEV